MTEPTQDAKASKTSKAKRRSPSRLTTKEQMTKKRAKSATAARQGLLRKLKRGAPSVYGQHIIEYAKGYLEHYDKLGDQVPTKAGLCITLGISYTTLDTWCRDPEKQEFAGLVAVLNQKQERALINGGLSGAHNSVISKLVLQKHGYVPITAHRVGGDEEGVPLAVIGVNGGTLSAEEASRLYFASLKPPGGK